MIMITKVIPIFTWIADFLFPSSCVNCGKVISIKQDFLCNKCFQEIIFIDKKCEICSGVLIDDRCAICSDRKLYVLKNFTIAEYRGVMKEILHNYKFNKKRRLHLHLSKLAYKKIGSQSDLFDLITSVPMSRKKKWQRGFNQSEIIAKRLSRKLNKVYHPLLKEKSRFKTQRELGYRERFLNILDRYKISNKNINGKSILLIDDVFTTGATINECARILKSFGATRVYSLTMARANIKRVEKN